MKEEKIDRLAKLIYSTIPQLRRDYVATPPAEEGKIPHHAMFTLLILQKYRKVSMSELANRLGVSNQQMTRIAGKMEEEGLIVRETNETNRRQVDVSMLPAGKELAEKYGMQAKEKLREKFGVLSEEELDELYLHLQAVIRLVQKTE